MLSIARRGIISASRLSIDPYTKLLLHMNGVDASTTFTDSSASAHTFTAGGNAQIDTAQYKFGGASGLFDGTGDFIDTPAHADFNVGSGDFTIDFWIKRGTTGVERVFGNSDNAAGNSSFQALFNGDNKVGITVYVPTAKNITSTGAIADTNYHHIAIVRDTNTLRLFIDGTADGTVDLTGTTIRDSAYKFTIGRMGEFVGVDYGAYFNGWIDEFRFSKGIARWTSNFTPPSAEYSA